MKECVVRASVTETRVGQQQTVASQSPAANEPDKQRHERILADLRAGKTVSEADLSWSTKYDNAQKTANVAAANPTPPQTVPKPAAPIPENLGVGDFVKFRTGSTSKGKADSRTYCIIQAPTKSASTPEYLRPKNPYQPDETPEGYGYEAVYQSNQGPGLGRKTLSKEDLATMVRTSANWTYCQNCNGRGFGPQREVNAVGWQQTLNADIYKYDPNKYEVKYVKGHCYQCKGRGWKEAR